MFNLKKELSLLLATGLFIGTLLPCAMSKTTEAESATSGIIAYDDFTSYMSPRLYETNPNGRNTVSGFNAYNQANGTNPNGGYGFSQPWQIENEDETTLSQPFITECTLKNGGLNANQYKYLGYFSTWEYHQITRTLNENLNFDGSHDYYASAVYYLGNFADTIDSESRGAQQLTGNSTGGTNFNIEVGNTSVMGGICYDGSKGGLVAKVTANSQSVTGSKIYRAGLAYRIIVGIFPNSSIDNKDVVKVQIVNEYATPTDDWDAIIETELDETQQYDKFGCITSGNGTFEAFRSFSLEKYSAEDLSRVLELVGNDEIYTVNMLKNVCTILPEGIGRSCILSSYGADENVAYDDMKYTSQNRAIYNGVNIPKFGFSSDWSKTSYYPYTRDNSDGNYWASFHNYDYWFDPVVNSEYAMFNHTTQDNLNTENDFVSSWPGIDLFKRLDKPIDLSQNGGTSYIKTRFSLFYSNNHYKYVNQKLLLGSDNDYIGILRYDDDDNIEPSYADESMNDLYVVVCINGVLYKTDICISDRFEDERKNNFFDYKIKLEPASDGKTNLYLKVTRKGETEKSSYDYVLKDITLSVSSIQYLGYTTPSDNGFINIASIEIEQYNSERTVVAKTITDEINANEGCIYYTTAKNILNEINGCNLQNGYLKEDLVNLVNEKSETAFEDFDYNLSESKTIDNIFDGGMGFDSPWAYDHNTFTTYASSNSNKNTVTPQGKLYLFVDDPVYRKLSQAVNFNNDGVYYISFDMLDGIENRVAALNDYLILGDNIKIGLKANESADSVTGYVTVGENTVFGDKPINIGGVGDIVYNNNVTIKIVSSSEGTDKIYVKYNNSNLEQSAWDICYDCDLSGYSADYIGFGNNKLATTIDNFVMERCSKDEDDAYEALDSESMKQLAADIAGKLQKQYFTLKSSFTDENKVETESKIIMSNALQNYCVLTSSSICDTWLNNGLEGYVNLKNATNSPKNMTVVLAIYSDDGKTLEAVKTKSVVVKAGSYSGNIHTGWMGTYTRTGNNAPYGSLKYGTSEAVPVDTLAGKTVKVFCLSELSDMKPYGDSLDNTFD